MMKSLNVDKSHIDIVSQIIEYESGEMSNEKTLIFFAELVKNGMAWTLQGSYGRMAHSLIEAGYIDRNGKILKNLGEEE